MHFIHMGFSIDRDIREIPILPLFDFCAAFPSVIHQWIFCCLRHRGFPRGLINFVLAIYHNAAAYTFDGGVLSWLFDFGSGVLQGCPASAFLFNIALDPFLNYLTTHISPRSGILRACADDMVLHFAILLRWAFCTLVLKRPRK